MDDTKRRDLERLILLDLQGKMSLLQPQPERIELVVSAIENILKTDKSGAFTADMISDDAKRRFADEFLGYTVLEPLLCDAHVEDIVINALKPIYIHHSQKGFVRTEQRFKHPQDLALFIQKILVFSGRTTYYKIANLELPHLAGRVNIADSPFGPQITITKAKVDPLSIIDLINRGSMSAEIAAQIWVYVEGLSIRPANIILAGGPGTGKTTLLNALMGFIPLQDRMVVIEDTLELNTFLDDSCSRLESDDEISLADLVKNSLRMRPERIIIGEVRGEEARDMITAVNIGKYCMGTIHALTSREAIIRLQNEPMNIPEMLVNLIDVFIVLKRYHANGRMFRVIDEISETGGMEHNKILLSQVFKYNYDNHEFVARAPSTVYRDSLAREAGLKPRYIIYETLMRTLCLKEMIKRDVHTMKEVTTFCRAYKENPEKAMAGLGLDREGLLKELNKDEV